jgi:hypothetical protein
MYGASPAAAKRKCQAIAVALLLYFTFVGVQAREAYLFIARRMYVLYILFTSRSLLTKSLSYRCTPYYPAKQCPAVFFSGMGTSNVTNCPSIPHSHTEYHDLHQQRMRLAG